MEKDIEQLLVRIPNAPSLKVPKGKTPEENEIVFQTEQALPQLPEQALIARDEREFLGPLSGLATGLSALDGLTDVAYLSSCDVPMLRPTFVRRVLARLGEATICMPDVGGFKHPLAAAYRARDALPQRSWIASIRGNARGSRRISRNRGCGQRTHQRCRGRARVAGC